MIGGLALAMAEVDMAISSLGSKDGAVKADILALEYVKNTFGSKVDLNRLVNELERVKAVLANYYEGPEAVLLVQRPYIGEAKDKGRGDERLYSGVRVVPKDPYERLVISKESSTAKIH